MVAIAAAYRYRIETLSENSHYHAAHVPIGTLTDVFQSVLDNCSTVPDGDRSNRSDAGGERLQE